MTLSTPGAASKRTDEGSLPMALLFHRFEDSLQERLPGTDGYDRKSQPFILPLQPLPLKPTQTRSFRLHPAPGSRREKLCRSRISSGS